MTLFDTCVYKGHPCVAWEEWEDPQEGHVLALHPTDGTEGMYFVPEARLSDEHHNDPAPPVGLHEL